MAEDKAMEQLKIRSTEQLKIRSTLGGVAEGGATEQLKILSIYHELL